MVVNIGIDLGTTYSCLAYSDGSGNMTIATDEGETILPSVVLFQSRGKIIVGQKAKDMAKGYPVDNTVETIKRHMGEEGAYCKFFDCKYDPPTISAMILRKLMERAEDIISREGLGNVVITHPAYFGTSQIKATREAGIIAGIPEDKLFLIDEPTAAAISVTHGKNLEKTVMVYDLGGGTFDVSILKISNNDVKCIATDGDRYLGGKDWDSKLMDYCKEKIEEETDEEITTDDLTTNKEYYAKLKFSVEDIKKKLSKESEFPYVFKFGDQEVTVKIKRRNFANASSGYVNRTIEIVDKCMSQNNINDEDIDEIILAGGSSRMPMISEAVHKRFPENLVILCPNPDEAVALGAAIFSSSIKTDKNGDNHIASEKGRIQGVMSRTYGVKAVNKDGQKIIANILYKNTALPIKTANKKFCVTEDNQKIVEFEVYENDGVRGVDTVMEIENTGQVYVGSFSITLPDDTKAKEEIEFSFGVDEQKSLNCTVIVKGEIYEYQFNPNTAMTTEEIKMASKMIMLID